MPRFSVPLIALLSVSIAAWIAGRSTGNTESAGPRLPGARATIDAAAFPSLQAALDAVPPGGGLVRLPAGTFEISEPLILRANDVSVEGAGTATHIKNVNTAGKPALVIEHPDGATSRTNELWRVRLGNFRITGNEASGHGIEARRINELLIQGVTASAHGGDGIRLYYCYEDPRTGDSLITYNKGVGLDLTGNVFSGLRPKALALEGDGNRRALFAGNVVADAESEHAKLRDSVVGRNLESAGAEPGSTETDRGE